MKIFIISVLLASLPLVGKGQTHNITPMLHDGYYAPGAPEYFSYASANRNEVQMFFSGLFLMYKTIISSQDGNRCNFSPSCSEYGLLAVKKKGAVLGILATLDRLQRCHPFEKKHYHSNAEGLWEDAP